MPEITLPRLSDSMEEGTIVRWLKASGDEVRRGEEIVEIETDKATMAYESDHAGPLTILADEGTTLPVGAPIAIVGAPDAVGIGEPVAVAAAIAATVAGTGAAPRASDAAPEAGTRPARRTPSASPVARRLAAVLGVALADVRGGGPRGRILKADVRAAAEALSLANGALEAPAVDGAPASVEPPVNGATTAVERSAAAPPPSPPARPATARGAVTVVELTRTQQRIALRMAESRSTVPSFEVEMDVDMTEALALRAELRTLAGDRPVPSLNDIVVKACAVALRDHPEVNASFRGGSFERYERVNVGFAVAAPGSLVVPTVFDADRSSLASIAATTRALAERVRTGAITPAELDGATFTISNLGMFGVTRFTAVINQPQAAILAVGGVTERPVVRDGEVVVRACAGLTLACDHRVLYGADGARFLGHVRDLLEHPLTLAL